jgi:ferredoxin--NADP+ reductase
MRLEDFDAGERFQARVLANKPITAPGALDEVRELVLEIDRPEFDCRIGQSVGLIVEGPFSQAGRDDLELGHQHHFRLYTVADKPRLLDNGKPEIKLCVRRCAYIDEFSGERYPGIASNYLCDRAVDDLVSLNGPFGLPFDVPADRNADLLLISMGTGIAPFRALVKYIYQDVADWQGRIWLFHGARTGLDLLYMNDELDDFSNYYDRATFKAFKALSPRPHWGDPVELDSALLERALEVLAVLNSDNGYVYVAGREDIRQTLETVFAKLVGSKQGWYRLKADMEETGRWRELIY